MCRARSAALLGAGLLLSTPALAACGGSKPAALPDDATFRSCLTAAGAAADSLDSLDARREAFAKPGAWDCVLGLSSAPARHAVLDGLFPADDPKLRTVMTAWIATRSGDGETVARDVGTVVAAADPSMPHDGAKASLRSDLDDEFQAELALVIYQHCDGELPGYDAYLARPDLKGDPSASNRYYQDMMDKGGLVADRLRSYASAIDSRRDALRAA